MAANGAANGLAPGAALAPPPGIAVAEAPGLASRNAAPSGNIHHEIARDIGQQVESMILAAKRNSETKVGAEIQKIKAKMESMNEKIKVITERVNRLEPANDTILKTHLQKIIAKMEEVWEGEVGSMKQELWQTIQAHNHNADLMKHHKDAIDQIRAKMAEVTPNAELAHVHGQLVQVDKLLQKEQNKQQQIDQFMHRLTLVQRQLNAGLEGWNPGGVPFTVPGAAAARAPKFEPAAAMAAAAAAAAAAGKQIKPKKGAKPAKTTKPGASSLAPTLRAEAAEFVPMGGGSWDEK